jgi:short-subunit dehydrogenase
MNLKSLEKQSIVITGATSGIGLTTARLAAEKGAKVMLIARNEKALRDLADEIMAGGGQASYAVADVTDQSALQAASDKAIDEFGGYDTWVNNAGGSIYGRIMDVPVEDFRRLFETNLWGVVNGSKIAVEHLRSKAGGALINIGSEVSDAPLPLQGLYAASKHAVKGFTDSLRMELEADGFPISVTLIQPTATDTPFPENARNYLPYEPKLPPPLYAPELAAEAILHCATHPEREFFVGGMAKFNSALALHLPRFYEKINESVIDSRQNSGRKVSDKRADGLYETHSELRQRGKEERFVFENSLYQRAKLHPFMTGVLLAGGTLWAVSRTKKRNDSARAKLEKGMTAALK